MMLLREERICVLLVAHNDDEAGRLRTRRLFTNINKNAKATTAGENIALDEDDGFRNNHAKHDFKAPICK